jgi:hypothetical protein
MENSHINPPTFLKHKKNALNSIHQMRDAWGTGFALCNVINKDAFETFQEEVDLNLSRSAWIGRI